MGRKRPKNDVAFTDEWSPSVKLCSFGLPEHPLCGKSPFGVNLKLRPDLRELIDTKRVSTHWVIPIDEDTVLMDGCLLCHLGHGYTAEDYAKHESAAYGGMSEKQIQEIVRLLFPDNPFDWNE